MYINTRANKLTTFRILLHIFVQISLIPILFNMNLKNYFFASLIGAAPSIFILVSLVSGISSKVEKGTNFDINLLSDPQISLPLAALAIMVLVINYIKKNFFRSKN